MLISTHGLITRNILKNMSENKKNMLSNLNFIYGSIKPDILSKYKIKKHYAKESYSMILSKIKILSTFNVSDIEKSLSIIKFSQELGVICHFLCDFFCIAHSEVWRRRYKIFTHIKYEKHLAKMARKFNYERYKIHILKKEDIKSFIDNCLEEHEKDSGYNNDIKFAYYVCTNIINYILESIIDNSFEVKYILN
ncbi:MAG: zinc dependent phospholipase C family protein [Clostridium perfringens]|nr:zinc dependent phospholipase C family protein [Clostridium perfringens]